MMFPIIHHLKQHLRFIRETKRASLAGEKIFILLQRTATNEGITATNSFLRCAWWKNGRRQEESEGGRYLCKAIVTRSQKQRISDVVESFNKVFAKVAIEGAAPLNSVPTPRAKVVSLISRARGISFVAAKAFKFNANESSPRSLLRALNRTELAIRNCLAILETTAFPTPKRYY